MAAGAVHQVQGVDQVILIILGRLLHQLLIEPVSFIQIRDNQPVGWHCLPMTERQVVVNPDLMAASQKQANRVTADITRSAGNKNSHGTSFPVVVSGIDPRVVYYRRETRQEQSRFLVASARA